MSDIPMILDRIGKTLAIDVSPHLEGHYALRLDRCNGRGGV